MRERIRLTDLDRIRMNWLAKQPFIDVEVLREAGRVRLFTVASQHVNGDTLRQAIDIAMRIKLR
jgi:hypothetical protein